MDPNSQATDQSTNVTEEQAEGSPIPNASVLEQISALLRGDSESESDAQGESAEGDDNASEAKGAAKASKASVKTLDQLAKSLGVDIAELYDVEVGLANKRKARLGDLKDAYSDVDNFTVERMQWEERRVEEESNILRTKNELASLIAMLPKDAIKPEFIKTLREKNAAVVAKENARTLEVIPAWGDDSVRQAELDGMRDHLVKAGFPANYLSNVSDHRTMKYIRENYLREKRINDALKRVEVKRDASKSRAASTPAKGARSPTRGERSYPQQDKVSQIQSLLRGK